MGPGGPVRQTTVTLPAISIFVDESDGFGMAAFAVFLEDFSTMLRESDGFWHAAGVEGESVLHAFNAFPGDVAREVVVGKMAIDAFESSVAGIVEPAFVLAFHDVAAGAELRSSRPGIKPGRAKAHKGPHPHSQQDQKTGDAPQLLLAFNPWSPHLPSLSHVVHVPWLLLKLMSIEPFH